MTAVWLLFAILASDVPAASSSPINATKDGSCTGSCPPTPPEQVESSTQGPRRCLLQSAQEVGVGEHEEDTLVDRSPRRCLLQSTQAVGVGDYDEDSPANKATHSGAGARPPPGFVDSPNSQQTPAWRNASSLLAADDARGFTRIKWPPAASTQEAKERLKALDAMEDAVPIASLAGERPSGAKPAHEDMVSTIQAGHELPTQDSWRPPAMSDTEVTVAADDADLLRLTEAEARKTATHLVGKVLVLRDRKSVV